MHGVEKLRKRSAAQPLSASSGTGWKNFKWTLLCTQPHRHIFCFANQWREHSQKLSISAELHSKYNSKFFLLKKGKQRILEIASVSELKLISWQMELRWTLSKVSGFAMRFPSEPQKWSWNVVYLLKQTFNNDQNADEMLQHFGNWRVDICQPQLSSLS